MIVLLTTTCNFSILRIKNSWQIIKNVKKLNDYNNREKNISILKEFVDSFLFKD